MRSLELKIPPLVLCLIFAVLIVVLGHLAPVAVLNFAGHRAFAIVILLGGIGIAASGVVQFRRAGTTVNPMQPTRASSIVATGIFGICRNPMYLGMALALLGLAAWRSALTGYVLVPVFCWYMTEFQIKPEERALLARFGDDFAAYMATVRRWL